MNAKETIRQMIREELKSLLLGDTEGWWLTPAEAEHPKVFTEPHTIHEEREKQKRPRVGKNRKGKYTSAGTIPKKQGRTLSPTQIKNRKEIGEKLLNMFRRGGEKGNKFRKNINNQLNSKEKKLPTTRNFQLSQIWANASDIAAKGGTAADVTISDLKGGKKSKKKASTKKKNNKSGDNQ